MHLIAIEYSVTMFPFYIKMKICDEWYCNDCVLSWVPLWYPYMMIYASARAFYTVIQVQIMISECFFLLKQTRLQYGNISPLEYQSVWTTTWTYNVREYHARVAGICRRSTSQRLTRIKWPIALAPEVTDYLHNKCHDLSSWKIPCKTLQSPKWFMKYWYTKYLLAKWRYLHGLHIIG